LEESLTCPLCHTPLFDDDTYPDEASAKATGKRVIAKAIRCPNNLCGHHKRGNFIPCWVAVGLKKEVK
jgi:hypothetical protein